MSEFKKFILKGNIIDMAVGVIIGGAFSKIVTSLVNDILMPALGAVTGGASFNTLKYVIHPAVFDEAGNVVTAEAAILYGSFIQNIVDFLIIGFCMFFMVKAIAMVTAKFRHEEEKEEPAPVPAGPTTEELLAEIRDLLKEKNIENL
ncbi:MAG: large-conductance mechanosensitive channel protein MscL [Hungatella sp.]|nr:large-conductance mechanosensitive channel protein MscL [Hungatella sp.]